MEEYKDIENVGVENEIEEEDTSSNEIITQPFSPNDIKLSTPPMNLGDLIDMISHGWINFGTEYQREENLWDNRKQSRLIESVLLGLRLPAFYFEEVSKYKWNIIDGLQRCCAIRNFCVDNSLVLNELEFLDQFNGKKYCDLPFEIVRDIRMLPITVNKLEPGVPDDVKYILFKRLNTGGVELKPQEIRNAVFQGRAIEVVKEMAMDKAFLVVAGYRIKNLRKQREDFVSRFIAFYLQNYTKFVPDLENFINKAMKLLQQNLSEEKVSQMKSDFNKSMYYSKKILGGEAFRKQENFDERPKPMNRAYFEVISTTFARLEIGQLEKLLEKRELLLINMHTAMRESKSYNSAFSGGTGQRDTVKRRFSWYEQIVNYSLEGKKIRIDNDNKLTFEEF